MKKIICIIIIAAILAASVSSLASCDELPNGYFAGEFKIKTNENYISEIVPEEFNLIISGSIKDGLIYFALNESAKIFLDLLLATDIIGASEKILFDGFAEYDSNSVLCVDINDFNSYIKKSENKFTVEWLFSYDIDVVTEVDSEKVFYYADIKAKIDKELLKLPGYRYSELFMVMNVDEDGDSYLNILATRENGGKELLEPVKLDVDLTEILQNPDILHSAKIIPMRYVFELFGETVGWNYEDKQAYIAGTGRYIYFDKNLVNSKTYISLLQIMGKTDYIITHTETDDFIEIKIERKYSK